VPNHSGNEQEHPEFRYSRDTRARARRRGRPRQPIRIRPQTCAPRSARTSQGSTSRPDRGWPRLSGLELAKFVNDIRVADEHQGKSAGRAISVTPRAIKTVASAPPRGSRWAMLPDPPVRRRYFSMRGNLNNRPQVGIRPSPLAECGRETGGGPIPRPALSTHQKFNWRK